MDQRPRGLSQEQQNDCRAALASFIERHDLAGWEMTIEVEETAPANYRVKIEITPSAESGLPPWPIDEVAVADTPVDVAAAVDRLLEAAYQSRLPAMKAH